MRNKILVGFMSLIAMMMLAGCEKSEDVDLTTEVTEVAEAAAEPEIRVNGDTEFGIYTGTAVVLLPEYHAEMPEVTDEKKEPVSADDLEAFVAAHDNKLEDGTAFTTDNSSVFYFCPLSIDVVGFEDNVELEFTDVRQTRKIEGVTSQKADETSIHVELSDSGSITAEVQIAYDDTLEAADIQKTATDGTTEDLTNHLFYEPGEYDVTIAASDSAGNRAETVLHITLDRMDISDSISDTDLEAYECMVNPTSTNLDVEMQLLEAIMGKSLELTKQYDTNEESIKFSFMVACEPYLAGYRADLAWAGRESMDDDMIYAAISEQVSNGNTMVADGSDNGENSSTGASSNTEKDAQARVIAQQIADSITGNTDLEKVRQAAKIVSEYCDRCTYTTSGSDYRTAYGVFCKGEYSCAGATRALGMVLECMGFSWEHMNPNQWTHQWCRLTMDGQIGWADGTGSNGTGGGGHADYGEYPLLNGGIYIDPDTGAIWSLQTDNEEDQARVQAAIEAEQARLEAEREAERARLEAEQEAERLKNYTVTNMEEEITSFDTTYTTVIDNVQYDVIGRIDTSYFNESGTEIGFWVRYIAVDGTVLTAAGEQRNIGDVV